MPLDERGFPSGAPLPQLTDMENRIKQERSSQAIAPFGEIMMFGVGCLVLNASWRIIVRTGQLTYIRIAGLVGGSILLLLSIYLVARWLRIRRGTAT